MDLTDDHVIHEVELALDGYIKKPCKRCGGVAGWYHPEDNATVYYCSRECALDDWF